MANRFNGKLQVFGPAGTLYASFFQAGGTVSGSGTLVTVTNLDGTVVEYSGTGLTQTGGVLTGGTITGVTIKSAGAVTLATLSSTPSNAFAVDTAGFNFLGAAATYNLLLSGNNLIVGSTNGTGGTLETLAGGAGNDTYQPGNAFTDIDDGIGVTTLDLSQFAGPATVDLLNQTYSVGGDTGLMSGVSNVIGTAAGDTITENTDAIFVISSGGGNDNIDVRGTTLYGARTTLDAGSGNDTVTADQNGYGWLNGGEGNDTINGGGDLRFYELRNFETLNNTFFLRVRTEQLRSVDQITDSNPFNGNEVGIELWSGGTVDFASLMADGLSVNVIGKVSGINVNGTENNDTFQDESNGLVNGIATPSKFFGGGGNDTLSNNSGKAIASFSGNMADYTITQGGGLAPPWIITDNRQGSPDGTDTLVFFNTSDPLLRFADHTASISEQLAYKADQSQLPAQIYNGVLDLSGPDRFNYESMFPALDKAVSETLNGSTSYTVTYSNGIKVVFTGTGLTTSGAYTPSGGSVTDIKVFDTTAPGGEVELAHFYSDALSGHLMRVPFKPDLLTGGTRIYQNLLSGNNVINGSANDDIIAVTNGHDSVDGNAGFDTMQFGAQFTSIEFQTGSTVEEGTVSFVDDPAEWIYREMELIDITRERANAGENIVNNPLPTFIKYLLGLFGGDPHVTTFDGVGFSFHALGEFVAAKSTVVGDPFEIQVRTIPFVGRATVVQQTATAVGTDIVTFDAGRSDTVLINGLVADFTNGPITLDGGILSRTAVNQWTIDYEGGERLDVTEIGTSIDFLSLGISPGSVRAPGTLQGILGNADGDRNNDFALPDTTVLARPLSNTVLYSTFADGWRVTDETSLLDYGVGETTGTFTSTAIPAAFSLADLPAEIVAAAEALVSQYGITDPGLREFAIYDYVLTGDVAVIANLANIGQKGGGAYDLEQPDAGQAETLLGVLAAKPKVTEADAGLPTEVTFNIYRTGPAVGSVTVDWTVADPGGGYFDAADYVGGVLPSGQVTLAQGESVKAITVQLADGAVTLASERVQLEISSPAGLPLAGGVAEATVVNNAPASGANANAEFVKSGGPGTLTHTGNAWTLDLGTLTENTTLAAVRLAVLNNTSAGGNDLSGAFQTSGALAAFSGTDTFLKLVAGATKAGLAATIVTSRPGTLSATLTLQATESNDTGFSGAIANETLTILANITDVRDTIIGTSAADVLTGEDGIDVISGLSGNDTLRGLGKNDVLIGGKGRDTMSGGTGQDDFDFNALTEMGKTAGTRDRITDFARGQDDIDLRTIDAKSKVGGNQNFTFIGTDSFHKKAGELRYFKINAQGTANDKTIVEGDVNGDGRADFQIELTGLKNLLKTDFIL